MTIKKVCSFLQDAFEKDPESFDKLINTRLNSSNPDIPTYSVLSFLNQLFATKDLRLAIYFDKKTKVLRRLC